jgi:PAS domain S-box-containing protein
VSPRVQGALIGGFVVLAALIIAVAYWVWAEQTGSMRTQAEANLVAVSELQADEITAWLKERTSDAGSVRDDRLLAAAAQQLLQGTADSRTEAGVRSRLASLQWSYGYVDVVLTAPDGRIILREPVTMSHALGANAEATITEAVRTGQVQSSDLYRAEDGQVRIEWAAPLLPNGPDGGVVGAVLLHADPEDYLYRVLEEWPIPTRTGESLLVERRGDEVLFLTDLRHREDAALEYAIPLARSDLPAAQAVQGTHGVATGNDYRGVEVLAAAQPVPGSPWYVVAKMDADEVLGPITRRGWTTAAFAFVSVALAGAGTILLWRRRETEVAAELLSRERKFSTLFEGMMEGVATHELVRDASGAPVDYRILDVNPAFAEQTGLAADDVRGRKGSEVFASEPPPFLEEYARAVETGRRQRFEGYVGALHRHLQVSVSSQGTERFAAIVQDVTARIERERQLHDSQERLRFALEKSHTGGWDLDLRDHTAVRTLEHDRIFGYDELLPDWTYEIFLDHVVPEDRPRVDASFQKAMSEQSDWSFECRIRRVDGEIRWIRAVGGHQFDGGGSAQRLAGIVQDITATKLYEQEIERLNKELEQRVADRTAELGAANKELEAFAYSVSHDLRAPLRHVSGFSSLLAARAGDGLDEKSRHYVERISASVSEMGELIDDLLAFSRAGRTELTIGHVDMEALVEEVLAPLLDETRDRSIDWVVAPLPAVYGDRALLRQVWANLLDNAVKYTRGRDPARIKVGAREEDHADVFYVCDNGVGFDMEYAHKLFGVFQRLHGATEFEGTGIGLANVQRIVSRLGGRAWAEGRVDAGATFSFSLPRRKEPSR